MTYTLITANRNYSSWSLRPWLLMKALGIPFEDRLEPFIAASNYGAFRSFSPTGQVPVLRHEGRTIYDSMGITLYLADRHEGWDAGRGLDAMAVQPEGAVTRIPIPFSSSRSSNAMPSAFINSHGRKLQLE